MPEAGEGGGWGSKVLSARLTCELVARTPGRPTEGDHVDLRQAVGGADRRPCAQAY